METNLSPNLKPNGSTLSFFKAVPKKVRTFFSRAARVMSVPFKKLWQFLCSNAAFARFVYVDFPPRRRRAVIFIKKHWLKAAVSAGVIAVALTALLGVTLKNTENSDLHAVGDDSADFGMVLQHYCTFDHSEKTHIAVKLSWEDGAVDLNDNKARVRISANVYPINLPDAKIKWSTSDKSVATVDESGMIEVTSPGKVKITASLVNYGKSARASLAVRQPVTGIFMPTSTMTLYTNGPSRLLQPRVFPENATNPNIVWRSKNTKVAHVDENGSVKPVRTGMTEIIGTTEDGGFEAKCFVTVVNPSVDVEELTVRNEEDMYINVGESVSAVVTVSPSNARNKTLAWSSDNEDVAVVSQTGRIRGVGEGAAYITVSSVNGVRQSFRVRVGAAEGKDPFDLAPEVIELPAEGTVTYTSYDTTFPQAVRIQMMRNPPPNLWVSGKFTTATEAETAEYMNPNNYYTDAYKYQFLDLSRANNVSADVLDAYLADKGVLSGMGAVFAEAAKKYDVSEVYLVAHACLESGNGTSELARGVDVNGETVYNLFGINAYNADPLGGGSSKAYAEGWTSVEAAITGGAEWISRYYINNPDGRQNTLYKMLWNPENPGTHQYATDIGWAVKQAVSIERIFSSFDGAVLSFDVPVYNGQIPPTLSPDM